MTLLQQFGRMSNEELGREDPALVNTACAVGLPETDTIDFAACKEKLDEIARRTYSETQRLHYLFDRNPARFNHSLAYFRAGVMVTVLQRDFGLRYAKHLIAFEDSDYFRDPANIFIHGALLNGRGTCSSLPVVYIAAGWRLGYPMTIATAYQHMYTRWDGGGDCFNIECTSNGFVSHPDDYYRNWPKSLTDEQVKNYEALVSLSPRQTMAHSMAHRGLCWRAHGCYREAVGAFAAACELAPDAWNHSALLVEAMNAWDRELRKLMVPGFPRMTLRFPQRWFNGIPRDLELGIVHMIVKQNLLTMPEYKVRWWEPLRCNPEARPKDLPRHILVEYPNGDDAVPGEPTITFHDTVPESFYAKPPQPA
jgi:hypothetical protein